MTSYTFEVPATSANLGPGFDAIGAALELRLRAHTRAHPDGFRIRFAATPHAPTHDGFKNDIIRGMRALVDILPPIELTVENTIPLGRGLGSSAAAIVLGLLAADAACELHTPLDTFIQRAARLEGHPDNTTPALTGGIVISVPEDLSATNGSTIRQRIDAIETPTYLRITPPPGIRAVVAIPDFSLATEQSRSVLPEAYAKADCIFNVQRAALLAASLASGDLTRLRVAMQDRMHQPYRARLVPGLQEAIALHMPGLLGVALSGAGPTILAFAEERSASPIQQAFHEIFDRHDIACETRTLAFAVTGATSQRRMDARTVASN